MKPIRQTRLSGKDGNCWPACVASIFEVSLEEVDHLSNHHPDWWERSQLWLEQRGFCFVEISRRADGGWPVTEISERSLVILSGVSQRGVRHVCICRPRREKMPNGDPAVSFELVHDPAGGSVIVDKIDAIILFVKL